MPARLTTRGWTSTPVEATKCVPEARHAFALIAPLDCIPSVRFLDAAVWVSHRPPFPEETQPSGPIGPSQPLPPSVGGEAMPQRSPRRLSVLLPEPTPYALPYPFIEPGEV